MKGLRFADSQKSRFQTSKRSNMGSALLLGGRSADIHDFCFHTAKRSDMECAELQGGSICLLKGMAFSGCETFR